MSRMGNLGGRLYRGDIAYDFVGHRRRWYAISALILLVAVVALATRGLALGVEFKGGAVFTVKTTTGSVQEARDVAAGAGINGAVVTKLNDNRIEVTTPPISTAESEKVQDALAAKFHVDADTIAVQNVGPTWGKQITKKAFTGLVVFVLLVALFLSVYFEWKMAVAGLIALVHDLVITVGIYALVGFEVSPATVIGVLTILGYSLYDTVVVFDKVRENTAGLAGGSRMTYSQAANLAVNQTLVRSFNTSLVALLPVAAILFIGVGVLGAGTLEDLALALFVGIAAGTYSSIFIATPILVQFKEREPAMQALARRVEARKSGVSTKTAKRRGKQAPVEDTNAADESVDEPVDEPDADDSTAAVAGAAVAGATAATAGPRGGPRPQPRRSGSKNKKRSGGKRR